MLWLVREAVGLAVVTEFQSCWSGEEMRESQAQKMRSQLGFCGSNPSKRVRHKGKEKRSQEGSKYKKYIYYVQQSHVTYTTYDHIHINFFSGVGFG